MSTRQPVTIGYGASADTSRSNSRGTERDPGGPIYKAATISFSGNTITDSANGFGRFATFVGALLEVRGSASNNRMYLVTAAGAGALTVRQNLTTESAGAAVTIIQAEG